MSDKKLNAIYYVLENSSPLEGVCLLASLYYERTSGEIARSLNLTSAEVDAIVKDVSERIKVRYELGNEIADVKGVEGRRTEIRPVDRDSADSSKRN